MRVVIISRKINDGDYEVSDETANIEHAREEISSLTMLFAARRAPGDIIKNGEMSIKKWKCRQISSASQ